MREKSFKKYGKLLTVVIVAVLSLVVAFSVAFTYDGRNDLNSVSQRQAYNGNNTGRTTNYGEVGMSGADYIARQGYAELGWTAISDANTLKEYIKNQNGKNGYITADINFDWNDTGEPYTAPANSGKLDAELILDGCGFTLVNTSTSYNHATSNGFKDNRGFDYGQEDIPGGQSTNYTHASHGTLFNVIEGTVKNIKYDLNSKHIFSTSQNKNQTTGVLAGYIANGANINNVSVKINENGGIGTYQMNDNYARANDNMVFGGGIAGVSKGTIYGVEVVVEEGGLIYAGAEGERKWNWGSSYTNAFAYAGGIVGRLVGTVRNAVFNGYNNREGTGDKYHPNQAVNALGEEDGDSTVWSYASLIVARAENSIIENVIANAPNGLGKALSYKSTDGDKYGYILGDNYSGNTISNYYRIGIDKAFVLGTGDKIGEEGSVIDLKGEGLKAQFDSNNQLVVSNVDTNKIVWGRSDKETERIFENNSNSYIVTGAAANAEITFTFGTTASVDEMKFDNASVEFDDSAKKARFYSAGALVAALDNARVEYKLDGNVVNDCVNVGSYTATYTASENKQVGADDAAKILYLYNGVEPLTANLEITQKQITANLTGTNVYDAQLTVSGLLGTHNVVVTLPDGNIDYATDTSPLNLENAGDYTIAVNNPNYKFAEGQTTEFTVAPKTIIVDSNISIVYDDNITDDIANIVDGVLTLNRKTDSITLKAVSDKYGMKITNFTVNGTATTANYSASALNGEYQASVALSNEVTNIGLAESVNTVNAVATASDGGSVTINVIGAEPSVSVTNLEVTIGTKVEYVATASSENYQFLGWTMDGKYVSFDSVYNTIVGSEGKSLEAVFSATGANFTIINGENGGLVANINIDLNILADYEIGDIIADADGSVLGSAAKGAVDGQVYNTFYGWKIVDKTTDDGETVTNYKVTAIYDTSTTKVNVTIDGVEKNIAVNSDITLEKGNYTVNGVSITVDEVTTLKALEGLTIEKDGGSSTENNATGAFDADNSVLQISAAVEDGMEIRVVISDSDKKNVISATIKGSVTMLGNVKIVQAIITVPTGYITATADKTVKAQIFKVNGESSVLIGEIVLTTAEVA